MMHFLTARGVEPRFMMHFLIGHMTHFRAVFLARRRDFYDAFLFLRKTARTTGGKRMHHTALPSAPRGAGILRRTG